MCKASVFHVSKESIKINFFVNKFQKQFFVCGAVCPAIRLITINSIRPLPLVGSVDNDFGVVLVSPHYTLCYPVKISKPFVIKGDFSKAKHMNNCFIFVKVSLCQIYSFSQILASLFVIVLDCGKNSNYFVENYWFNKSISYNSSGTSQYSVE